MKYNSIYGRYDSTIEADGDSLVINGEEVGLLHIRDLITTTTSIAFSAHQHIKYRLWSPAHHR